MRVLHIVRHRDDSLAWQAIRVSVARDEVRVALLHDAAAEAEPGGDGGPPAEVTLMLDPEYDQIMESIEWAEKVVTW